MILMVAAVFAAAPAFAQNVRRVGPNGSPYTVPPTPPGQLPANTPFNKRDIVGKWVRVSPFETYGAVPGGIPTGKDGLDGDGGLKLEEAPFTPAGRERLLKNLPSYGRRQVPPRLGNDPQMMCDPMGVPRILNGQVKDPHATLEIAMLPDRMLQMVQWHHHWREVWTDGRALPKLDANLQPTWNGYSVGRWDGDTFVVDSVGFDERSWLDHNGYPHTEAMRLEERYRRVDVNTLELQMTVTDPEYYSKPFKSDLKVWKLDRKGVKEWDEQIFCVPSEEFKFNNLIRDANVGKQK
jgi:hypothetical protein